MGEKPRIDGNMPVDKGRWRVAQHRVGRLPIVPSPPWPVRWTFATGASLAPLVYEILPAGPGKLPNELHTAKRRHLVGAYVFEP